jgi:hypothetical protein
VARSETEREQPLTGGWVDLFQGPSKTLCTGIA